MVGMGNSVEKTERTMAEDLVYLSMRTIADLCDIAEKYEVEVVEIVLDYISYLVESYFIISFRERMSNLSKEQFMKFVEELDIKKTTKRVAEIMVETDTQLD